MDSEIYFVFNPKDPRLKICVELYDGIVSMFIFFGTCCSSLAASQIQWLVPTALFSFWDFFWRSGLDMIVYLGTLQAIANWQKIQWSDQHHWSCCLHFLDLGKRQTEEDIIGHWKKLVRQQASSLLWDWTCQFCNFTTDPQSYWVEL